MGLLERDSDADELLDRVRIGLLDIDTAGVELEDNTGEPVYTIDCVRPGL
jgi:hypothetical protein